MIQHDIPLNPDDALTDHEYIMKYQLEFTKQFGPKYVYGVSKVITMWETGKRQHNFFKVTARVKLPYQPIRGKTTQFEVDERKFQTWRKNIKLLDFVSAK